MLIVPILSVVVCSLVDIFAKKNVILSVLHARRNARLHANIANAGNSAVFRASCASRSLVSSGIVSYSSICAWPVTIARS